MLYVTHEKPSFCKKDIDILLFFSGVCLCDDGFIGVDCSGTVNAVPVVDAGVTIQTCTEAGGCNFVVITGVFLEVNTIVCQYTRLVVSYMGIYVLFYNNLWVYS